MDDGGNVRWGVPRDEASAMVVDDRFGLLTGRPAIPPGATVREVIDSGDAFAVTSNVARMQSLCAPVAPVNLLCAGRNYRSSGADEPACEHPLPALELFMKPMTAVQHPIGSIVLPQCGDDEADIDAEGELAVLIGTMVRHADESAAREAIVGCTVAIDVTDRRWQTSSGPPLWMRGKGFDTFCPVGPELVTDETFLSQVVDGEGLPIYTRVNERTIRNGTTGQMARSVTALIAEISRAITILPGTLLLTGAPPLVSDLGDRHRGLVHGDVVEAAIDGIGSLAATVQSSAHAV